MNRYKRFIKNWEEERNVNFERFLRLFLKFQLDFEKEIPNVQKLFQYLDKGCVVKISDMDDLRAKSLIEDMMKTLKVDQD